ncbi:hypothetical protein EON82_08370 [bacterium]|nr:MAG: hypothetical protein EON82_08370 [bacterium]
MAESTGDAASTSRLNAQLDRLLEEGCCPPGDMIVFPVSMNSGSLADLARTPGIRIERIGPDVVRVRREN